MTLKCHNDLTGNKIYNIDRFTEVLQWHNCLEHYNYDSVVDWALKQMENGHESENIVILASFSKPVDRNEMKPYIYHALKELGYKENYGYYSIIANTHYLLEQILNNFDIRQNLKGLYKLCLDSDYNFGLMPFYLLYHSWQSLDELEYNYYYEGATLDNIDNLLQKEAQIWIDEYIHGIKVEKSSTPEVPIKPKVTEVKEKKLSYWQIIKRKLKF